MLKEKKTYKDDMLVGDLVENREFDVNCNFEIYDCTEKGSDWQKGAKKIFSTISEGWVIDGRETAANLRLSVGSKVAGRVRGVRNPVHALHSDFVVVCQPLRAW